MAGSELIYGTDTPTEALVSSVGPLTWPPSVDSENLRRRGMLRDVITNASRLGQVMDEFAALGFNDDVTRNSGRTFITDKTFREYISDHRESADPYIEALVPLRGCGVPQLEDTIMVYLGENVPERLLTEEEMDSELRTARNIFGSDGPGRYHSHQSIEFMVIDGELRGNADIQLQFEDLYSAFGWKPDAVAKILGNDNNMLVGAFNGSTLISTGMAERAEVQMTRDGEAFGFTMYEITEAATREEYRGNGLYLEVALIINRLLTETDANLVFGESNLAAPGVLKAAYRQGRNSALNVLREFGLTEKPLRQVVRISGGSHDERPPIAKNDLLVTFLTREDLLKRHGKKNN